MNKIKKLEQLIEYWKAKELKAKNSGLTGAEAKAMTMQHALNLALSILKQPSNQAITTDAYCHECRFWIDYNYCPNCGTKLER